MGRKTCSETQLLIAIARCVRRGHKIGSRCDRCLPTRLMRVDPPQHSCNWCALPSHCGQGDCQEDCELEVLEAIEEMRRTYNVEWPARA